MFHRLFDTLLGTLAWKLKFWLAWSCHCSFSFQVLFILCSSFGPHLQHVMVFRSDWFTHLNQPLLSSWHACLWICDQQATLMSVGNLYKMIWPMLRNVESRPAEMTVTLYSTSVLAHTAARLWDMCAWNCLIHCFHCRLARSTCSCQSTMIQSHLTYTIHVAYCYARSNQGPCQTRLDRIIMRFTSSQWSH